MLRLLTLNQKFLIILFIFSYLIFNTGIHGDELFEILKTSKINSFYDFIIYTDELITSPLAHIFFWWTYPVIGSENLFLYDLLKISLHLLSIYFLYKFFSQYLDNSRSFFSSLIFILYPTHDSSVFVYMFTLYTFVPCLIMYCHYKINRDSYLLAYPLLVFASFTHYLTPPYIIGLSVIFLLERKFKKFIVFISSFFLYFIYYAGVGLLSPQKEKRVDDGITIISLIKNIFLQITTSIDAFFGPSFFLKIFYSLKSLNLYSLIIGCVIIFILINYKFQRKQFIPWKLLISLFAVFVISLFMFALTNMYSQITFGLGNRVTIYGSLLLSVLIFLIPLSKFRLSIIFIIFLLPNFGLSEHWKSWNSKQLKIISNINLNDDLNLIGDNDLLLVTQNNYSELGPFSHIEFFSMDWNTRAIFSKKIKTKKIMSLSKNIKLSEGYIIDKKSGEQIKLNENIFLYDSNKNDLRTVKKNEISDILNKTEINKRHWVQFLENTIIKDIILFISPRLSYLFKDK